MMKRLLYIAHRLPYPPNKGERVRAFRQIVTLSDVFEVTVAAAYHRSSAKGRAKELKRWCGDVLLAPAGGSRPLRGMLSLLAGKSLTEGYFHNARLLKLI
ncbi:MAG: TIGR03087 family PEP-CTERM/XrtA system glycosyltransferase, partial [Planctomycetota bacterium]